MTIDSITITSWLLGELSPAEAAAVQAAVEADPILKAEAIEIQQFHLDLRTVLLTDHTPTIAKPISLPAQIISLNQAAAKKTPSTYMRRSLAIAAAIALGYVCFHTAQSPTTTTTAPLAAATSKPTPSTDAIPTTISPAAKHKTTPAYTAQLPPRQVNHNAVATNPTHAHQLIASTPFSYRSIEPTLITPQKFIAPSQPIPKFTQSYYAMPPFIRPSNRK